MKTLRDEFLEMTYDKSKHKMLVCLKANVHGNGLVQDKMARYKVSYDEYMLAYKSLLLEDYLIVDDGMLMITEKGRILIHRKGGFSPSLIKRASNAITTNATTIISIVALVISILSYLKDRTIL